ncbi:unnamed protein product [Protopolystoma xenopodis]|uniref:Uncharacterized protein n=1 Tax=Protopolystoma xenopodis TaxID=117903 RepID=A0A3S5B0U9_9PLAT|nr:unnamed protein product [Protopolystoma xenopodis]
MQPLSTVQLGPEVVFILTTCIYTTSCHFFPLATEPTVHRLTKASSENYIVMARPTPICLHHPISGKQQHTHTHIHKHIFTYAYIPVTCVCFIYSCLFCMNTSTTVGLGSKRPAEITVVPTLATETADHTSCHLRAITCAHTYMSTDMCTDTSWRADLHVIGPIGHLRIRSVGNKQERTQQLGPFHTVRRTSPRREEQLMCPKRSSLDARRKQTNFRPLSRPGGGSRISL